MLGLEIELKMAAIGVSNAFVLNTEILDATRTIPITEDWTERPKDNQNESAVKWVGPIVRFRNDLGIREHIIRS